MKKNYARVNKEWWEKMVEEDCGFTRPWLNLDAKLLQKFVKGKLKNVPGFLKVIYPISVLADVKNKKVLCLAAGGGQQSAVFGILGADVTVIDISVGQLKGDKKAAKKYGYKIKTIQGDISDLSDFKNGYFDLVYQASSMAYVPNVKKVYSGVARILKPGGLYRADAENPIAFSVDDKSWNGRGYSIVEPYEIKKHKRSNEENVIEFRHYLSEIFNGLIECGFEIERVQEMPLDLYQQGKSRPNTWEHSLFYVPGMFAILARKIFNVIQLWNRKIIITK